MTMKRVIGVAEARAALPALVREMAHDPKADAVVIGSHRSPSAVLIPYERYRPPRPTLEMLRSKVSLLRTLATAHKVSTVSVIGSVARGESREDSDVDLLCDVEPGRTLYDIVAFEADLEQALGYPVTVVTRDSLGEGDSMMIEGAVALC